MTRPGIRERQVQTERLRVHLRQSGSDGGTPVVLVHGNASSGVFYEDLMLALPTPFSAYAPDLRGYGDTEPLPVDATRGVRDFSDDLKALAGALGLGAGGQRFHLAGWSLGGAVAMQYAIDHAPDLLSLTLIAPGSPYGYGGTRGPDGRLIHPDAAGSGGGAANPEFVRRLREQDRSADSPFSPRNVMNAFYWKPPFKPAPDREEAYLEGILKMSLGPGHYPGDAVSSPHWPGFAPGRGGFLNALSPRYCNLAGIAAIQSQVPILWVRGDSDQIVSDTSLFEMGYLGQIGAVPGWPGADAYPPQPMVSQTRAVLERYRANGGTYTEVVLPGCGHGPHIEQPTRFGAAFVDFLGQHS